MIEIVKKQILLLKDSFSKEELIYRKGKALYINGNCQVLTQSIKAFELLITDIDEINIEVKIAISNDEISYFLNGKAQKWDSIGIAALMQISEELDNCLPTVIAEGKKYTREGMIKRVLAERQAKASKSKYQVTFADNIYGEHILINEKGIRYKITLRDFETETGYIDNPDLKTNKLGTTKHIMYAFALLKSDKALFKKLSNRYPFVEVYLDPLNDYRITWHYPHYLSPELDALKSKYFGTTDFIQEDSIKNFLPFINEARAFQLLVIRPEVEAKVQRAWDKELLKSVQQSEKLDFSLLKAELFPYQQEGVAFAVFRDAAILADEMGLGKTIQAIATAVMKKKFFGFTKTLIVCPASLKEQWRQEIAKFSFEQAVIADGPPDQRANIYRNSKAYFIIVNYETILRDWREINRMETDFIILDEAQKIKNFSTLTAQSIKLLEKKHALVITGTPIENRLVDLYSIVQFIDPTFLSPLWEFSYQHCYFDETKQDKITGYYNLQQLNEKLTSLLLRREKRKVISELPQITEITVPVDMHLEQEILHANFAKGISVILRKKFISPFDMQRLMLLMSNMRMVCDSTYLIDKESHISPKLAELKSILLEKLDLKNSDSKIIIFSEWVTMLQIIGKMLHELGIGFAQLTGKVAVKNRDALVKKFETDSNCKVFLSTEAGGTGLNLQVADTVINFEVPWNPAKKNQRVGRIDRLGQRSKHLNVINLITRNSIELKIASGLTLKQNLFDGVLNSGSDLDIVDFSASGKAQFLQQLEDAMDGFTVSPLPDMEISDAEPDEMPQQSVLKLITDEEITEIPSIRDNEGASNANEDKVKEMEQVMNQGLDFFSGLFKMSTGKDMGLEGRKLEIDKQTGEVVMRFKMPVF